MTDISSILEAREELRVAHEKITKEAKGVISDLVMELFKDNPDRRNVGWAQKTSEYDDQGLYPGIHGPNWDLDENDRYPYFATAPTNLKPLEQLLDAVGVDVLSDLFGDEHVVIVRNPNHDRSVFKTFYAGC